MSDRMTVTIDHGVADVRMNRPDKLNALDGAQFDALIETADALALDPSVRAVVLSGEGRSFCAGLDFSSFGSMAEGGSSEERSSGGTRDITAPMEGRITHKGQQAAWGWAELPMPVIAAVKGHALGGGSQIALAADIRLIHPDTKFSVKEVHWGLVPDMTGTQSLIRLVGLDVAKELVFTAKTITGAEAVDLGLATRLSDDPLADALELAGEIAARSPHAVRAAKRILNTADQGSLADGFAAERVEIASLIGSPNQIEAVMSNLEKRPADFADVEG